MPWSSARLVLPPALAIVQLEHNGLAPGQGPVAVTGATGGVGLLAIDMLAARGYEVIAFTRKTESTALLKQVGASDVRQPVSGAAKPLDAELWAGAIDNVGGAALAQLLSRTRMQGGVAAVGLAGGAELNMSLMPFLLRGVNLLGVNSAATRRDKRLAVWRRIAAILHHGISTPSPHAPCSSRSCRRLSSPSWPAATPAARWSASMTMNAEETALARQRLLVVVAMMLETLYEDAAVQVLATLKPADMRPGGARVPGTSYELPAATAVRAMQQLLELRGGRADALLASLADADIEARMASLSGRTPPALASLYAHCTADIAATGSDTLVGAMQRLYDAAGKIFTNTHMRRIDEQFHQWTADPAGIDRMPVQMFVARFIRNAP